MPFDQSVDDSAISQLNGVASKPLSLYAGLTLNIHSDDLQARCYTNL